MVGLLWAIYNTVCFFKGIYIYYQPENIEEAKTWTVYLLDTIWFGVFRRILVAYGLIELFIRIWLVKMLGCILWNIAKLMKTSKKLKVLRKSKFKEWIIFISICMAVAIYMEIAYVALLKVSFKWKKWFFRASKRSFVRWTFLHFLILWSYLFENFFIIC